jgi:hypothetical protein
MNTRKKYWFKYRKVKGDENYESTSSILTISQPNSPM